MIEQNVQVIRCRDERLWVQMGAQAGCQACEAGKGCGAGVFSRLLRRKPVVLELPRNDVPVQVGQLLTLAIPERAYLALVFGSYGWPLLAALVGALVGFALAGFLEMGAAMVDVLTLLGGVVFAVIATRLYTGRFRGPGLKGKLQSVVYYPASHPNMCKRVGSENTADKRV